MSLKHIIIPVFVPHKGCPHDCIFCNQKKISGQTEEMLPEKVPEIIETHLGTIAPGSFVEVAFYGGSFTAIDKELQRNFLEKVSPYLSDGSISEIRLSTRPDCIDEEILEMLLNYGVKTIELGVQSLDDEVLKASCRGHDSAVVYKAAALIKEKGIRLGIQTMTGLPGDTREKCLETAKKVILLAPEIVRIYPVLVIKGTGLEKLLLTDKYKPQTIEDAVDLCAELLELYEANHINVIRIGLQASEKISAGEETEVAAGPVHAAFRQLVESRLMLKRLEKIIDKRELSGSGELFINTGKSNISNVIGQKRSNIEYLKNKYGFGSIIVQADNKLNRELIVKFNK